MNEEEGRGTWIPTGFYRTVGKNLEETNSNLKEVITNLKESNQSSSRLAEALNRFTKWGVWVASIGVLVAALSLGFEICKYLFPR